jgi:hypothetical protein
LTLSDKNKPKNFKKTLAPRVAQRRNWRCRDSQILILIVAGFSP